MTSVEWKSAILGGIVSILLTIGYNRFVESEIYSLVMVTVGGILAGYLVRQHSHRVNRTGIVAGAIGALPAGVLSLHPIAALASQWLESDATAFTVLVVPAAVLSIIAIGALLGLIGAVIGEWGATKLTTSNGPQIRS